jgi:hypothetical protein
VEGDEGVRSSDRSAGSSGTRCPDGASKSSATTPGSRRPPSGRSPDNVTRGRPRDAPHYDDHAEITCPAKSRCRDSLRPYSRSDKGHGEQSNRASRTCDTPQSSVKFRTLVRKRHGKAVHPPRFERRKTVRGARFAALPGCDFQAQIGSVRPNSCR